MGNFFVRRPIVAMVIAIVILIVGTLSLLNLPMEQYPDITPPMVEVRATYTGANALNVEQSVATPLEQQINGVDNMIYMKSINANDGSMNIQITFEVGTDPDMNTVFSQNRVSSATPMLPEEVKRIGVNTDKTMSSMIMAISLYSDGRYDQDFLGNYALINIKDILARIKGVGRVNVLGASDYSMRIWVQPDKLAHLGITVPEITNAIRAQNVVVPGGKFGAEPAPEGTDFTYSVRMPERLVSEEEFGSIVIRTLPDGSQVRISDVASVELGVESYNVVARFAKEECAIITLYQAPGTNAVDLASQVIAAMDVNATHYRRDQGDCNYPSYSPVAGDPGGFYFYTGFQGHPDSHHCHSCFIDWSLCHIPTAWVYHQCVVIAWTGTGHRDCGR
jgi:HAE1 family hydrophobic/amphiphilic exporter-1